MDSDAPHASGCARLRGFMAFPGSKEVAEIFEWARKMMPLPAGVVLGFYFGRISR